MVADSRHPAPRRWSCPLPRLRPQPERARRKKTARAASTLASTGRSTRPRGSRRAGRWRASSPGTRSRAG